MKPSDLSEFFNLLGKAKKEKEEEFDNLLKEADINLDDLTSSLVSGIKEAKEDQKKQKKNEEKLIEQLDSIIDVIENPKEVKDITEPAVTVGVPEDFDVTTLEDADDNETVEIIDIIKPEPIKTPEISDTVAQAIKFIEETNIKEEIENSDDTNLDKLKTEIKQVRDILYKVLAHGPGSGEVRVLRMDDVDITDLGDEKVLSYDASSEKLKFVEQSGGSGVSTENVRTGILDVAGIATFRNDTLVGTGITLSPDGDVFVTGVTTATKFVGDGSGLTGITASGSGVVVQDEGSNIGTAATINFIGSNVTAALSGGIANVTVTPGITTANVRTGILDVAGIATFRNDTLIGSGVTLSPDGDIFATGVTTSSSFVGDLTGDVTGTASNATQLNSQAASYYLDYDNFSNTPTIPSNNNQLTNGAGYITGSALNASNLSSGTIPDARFPSTLPAIDGSALTGIAVTDNIRTNTNATFLQNVNVSGTTTATTFIGNLTGNVTGNVSGSSGSSTGNAATATALANARTIGGVSFDGSANIDLPGVNSSGNQDTTGNAATATKLAATKTIAGVAFDGSANISLNNNAITNGAGYITTSFTNTNQLTNGAGFITASDDITGNAATSTKLATARTIAGVSFDGSANISLNNNAITNGAGYITTSFTNTNQLTNGAGFIDGSALNASNLSSGTIPDARFPSALPAIDGSALTGMASTDNVRTGILDVAGISTFRNDINIPDDAFVRIGNDTGGDFKITHTNNKTIARQHGSGNFILDLLGDNKSFVVTRSNLSEKVAEFFTNGPVDLYYDNVKRFETSNTGINVTGDGVYSGDISAVDATFSGNVSIGGTLTYEDVTNVDSVGLLTARSGIRVTGGVIEALAGENKIPSLYANMGALPSAGSYHGMFAHVHATGKAYYAHGGNWIKLVSDNVNVVSSSTQIATNISGAFSAPSASFSTRLTTAETELSLTLLSGSAQVKGLLPAGTVSSSAQISNLTGVSINTSLGRMRYAIINLRKIIKRKGVVLSS